MERDRMPTRQHAVGGLQVLGGAVLAAVAHVDGGAAGVFHRQRRRHLHQVRPADVRHLVLDWLQHLHRAYKACM